MITRSHAASESGSVVNVASGSLSAAEAEILKERIAIRERTLREQAEALRENQEELEEIRRDTEMAASGSTEDLDSRVARIEQVTAALASLPGQIKLLCAQVKGMQVAEPAHDAPNMFYEERPRPESSLSERRETIRDTSTPIRLKDVIDSIPKYDGHKISVSNFCKACERACKLIAPHQEYHLVQLIINKLQGHAYTAVEGTDYSKISELTKRLRQIFGPNKTVDQYRGELANIYMKPNEDILDYIERVKELRTAILDGETYNGYLDEYVRQSIERSAFDSFINGLPADLLVRVKLEMISTGSSLDSAITCAIQLSKTLEAESLRKRATGYRPGPPFRADVGHMEYKPRASQENIHNGKFVAGNVNNRYVPFIRPLIPGQAGPNAPRERICFYCKNPGHFANECQKLAERRSATQEQNNAGNAASVPVTSGVRRDAPQIGHPSTSMMITKKPIVPLPTLPE